MHLSTITCDDAGRWSGAIPTGLDSERTLVLAFGASDLLDHPAALGELTRAFPRSSAVGCSTAGEIAGGLVSDGGVVVAIVQFEHTRLRVATASINDSTDSRAAGRSIAARLADPALAAVLVFSDGLHVNGSELVAGMNDVLPASVLVSGGLAGDGSRFQRTWVLSSSGPCERVVQAVGLYGDRVRVGHGSQGGWDIFGPERRITKSTANVLYELDGQPALDLYKAYLGERAHGLPATALLFPLSLRAPRPGDARLVRTVLSVSEADRSLTFAGDMPKGTLAQLMHANFDHLIEGAAAAARMVDVTRTGQGPTLSIAVSCVGRRIVLGGRSEEELEAALGALPLATMQVGFYSYGEISPHANGACDLHNQTMTLTTIAED